MQRVSQIIQVAILLCEFYEHQLSRIMKTESFTNMHFYKVPVYKSHYYELSAILSKNLLTPEQLLSRYLLFLCKQK